MILVALWIVIFITWSVLFFNSALKTYSILHEKYLVNVFQLLNYDYLDSLREYFFENTMVCHLLYLVPYHNSFYGMLTWIIGSLILSLFHFYLWLQKNTIYEDGILSNGKLTKWDEVIDYEWSNVYERKFPSKNSYYNMIITLKKIRLGDLDLDNKIKLKVPYNDKELVDDTFTKYINKEKN